MMELQIPTKYQALNIEPQKLQKQESDVSIDFKVKEKKRKKH